MPVIAGARGTITSMWGKVAEQIKARRAELRLTRDQLAQVAHVSARLLGDLENARRSNYDEQTLGRVAAALGWQRGAFERMRNGHEPVLRQGQDEPASWLSTREGIARHLYRDDLPLVELLHRSGLDDTAKFKLILNIRAAREAQQQQLLGDTATAIRDAGGWAPERAYPPSWLVDDEGAIPT